MKNFVYNNITGINITKGLRFFGMDNDEIEGLFLNDVNIDVVTTDYDCQFVHGSFNDLSPNPSGECPELLSEDLDCMDTASEVATGNLLNGVLIGLVAGIGFMILLICIWQLCGKTRAQQKRENEGQKTR
eukprot:TRINITY_DN2682_c0_g1_i1.p1 TRINITY_DN2682_c0_g1~~TRINITY_DN2682_c0_g1_i1.p1  ORF type:complete len:130 (+),score=28.54 TRINITY_DN2682_c0_g1_i1:76-465(+)